MVRIHVAIFTIRWIFRSLFLFVLAGALVACGGGSGSSRLSSDFSSAINYSTSINSSNSGSLNSLSSSQTSLSGMVNISGKITYDSIPQEHKGLNYSAVTARSARGLLVELLDENNQILATTQTDINGIYSLTAVRNSMVKIRAKAQLLRVQSPSWNIKVTDNTSSNALYSMTGSLASATDDSAVRNLHAPCGWTGSSYTEPRVAAPFAILDTVYEGITRLQLAGNQADYPLLELRWSTKNKPADGDINRGEIGTSFFGGDAIYILGDENNDTDEYDRHVILHEWGHYIEFSFGRSDSIGGDHSQDEKLDMRVAMSEGFANAFSAMILDDVNYRDSSGQRQNSGFSNDISRKNNSVRGWYSEASVQSVIYNFYASASGKTAKEFADIFQLISSINYVQHNGLISIYTFADQLRKQMPGQIANFNNLLFEQNIEITDEYGAAESNSGGYAANLPVYKDLPLTNAPVNVCSSNRFGSYNKLATAQFFRITITTAGTYRFTALEAGTTSGNSDPDFYLYRHGNLLQMAEDSTVAQESFSRFLAAGTYILELADARVRESDETNQLTACFDVRAQIIN